MQPVHRTHRKRSSPDHDEASQEFDPSPQESRRVQAPKRRRPSSVQEIEEEDLKEAEEGEDFKHAEPPPPPPGKDFLDFVKQDEQERERQRSEARAKYLLEQTTHHGYVWPPDATMQAKTRFVRSCSKFSSGQPTNAFSSCPVPPRTSIETIVKFLVTMRDIMNHTILHQEELFEEQMEPETEDQFDMLQHNLHFCNSQVSVTDLKETPFETMTQADFVTMVNKMQAVRRKATDLEEFKLLDAIKRKKQAHVAREVCFAQLAEQFATTEAASYECNEFAWSKDTSLDTKLAYIQSCGVFTMATQPKLIARFLATFVDVNKHMQMAEMIEKYLSPMNYNKHNEIMTKNLAFCRGLKPSLFVNTPYQHYTVEDYQREIYRMQLTHLNNTKLATHFVGEKNFRAAGLPTMPLYEPPPMDEENAPGQNNIKYDIKVKLMDFLWSQAANGNLRHSEKSVYAPVYTKDGHNTLCYVKLDDLEPWIRKQFNRHVNPLHTHAFLKDTNLMKSLMEHLGKHPDSRFPVLERCRTLFSFENGVYCADRNKFFLYMDTTTPLTAQKNPRIGLVSELKDNISSAKYFADVIDMRYFEPGFNYRSIKCPKTESIFTTCQGYSEDDMCWVEALCGRMQHDVGNGKEDWQTAIHIQGPGKTGKSVFLHLLQNWYQHTDVGFIGDDAEKTFSDQHLVGKFIVMCMDISREFGITPTRFLNWCSGDWMAINRKFLDVLSVKWTAPVIFASNSLPPIVAAGGASFRRFIIFQLLNAVEDSDTYLQPNAMLESSKFLLKCSFAYHEKVNKHGHTGLWDNHKTLPKRFWDARQDYTKASSWPDAFLASGKFFFQDPEKPDPSYFITEQEFKKLFLAFKEEERGSLEGVNANRKTMNVGCTPMDFANCLKDYKCKWDSKNNVIRGLKHNPASRAAPVAAPQPSHLFPVASAAEPPLRRSGSATYSMVGA